eukprot:GHVH01004319.1.p1 GENE.GHVH01004319.1~~GHVH01004319.1.p1  ORF type:complete len:554 (-),score=79.81 GHVH01004319.1:515-2176(-)
MDNAATPFSPKKLLMLEFAMLDKPKSKSHPDPELVLQKSDLSRYSIKAVAYCANFLVNNSQYEMEDLHTMLSMESYLSASSEWLNEEMYIDLNIDDKMDTIVDICCELGFNEEVVDAVITFKDDIGISPYNGELIWELVKFTKVYSDKESCDQIKNKLERIRNAIQWTSIEKATNFLSIEDFFDKFEITASQYILDDRKMTLHDLQQLIPFITDHFEVFDEVEVKDAIDHWLNRMSNFTNPGSMLNFLRILMLHCGEIPREREDLEYMFSDVLDIDEAMDATKGDFEQMIQYINLIHSLENLRSDSITDLGDDIFWTKPLLYYIETFGMDSVVRWLLEFTTFLHDRGVYFTEDQVINAIKKTIEPILVDFPRGGLTIADVVPFRGDVELAGRIVLPCDTVFEAFTPAKADSAKVADFEDDDSDESKGPDFVDLLRELVSRPLGNYKLWGRPQAMIDKLDLLDEAVNSCGHDLQLIRRYMEMRRQLQDGTDVNEPFLISRELGLRLTQRLRSCRYLSILFSNVFSQVLCRCRLFKRIMTSISVMKTLISASNDA